MSIWIRETCPVCDGLRAFSSPNTKICNGSMRCLEELIEEVRRRSMHKDALCALNDPAEPKVCMKCGAIDNGVDQCQYPT